MGKREKREKRTLPTASGRSDQSHRPAPRQHHSILMPTKTGRTGCTADPWRCAALSPPIALSFAADGKDKHRDADAALQGQHELQRYKSRNELHRGVAQGASTSITGAAPSR